MDNPTRLAVLAAVVSASLAQAQHNGKVVEVQVFRGAALVSREVAFEAKPGAQEVVIDELPALVVPASLYATGDDGLNIRAVRYRESAVKEEPKAELRQLDQQLAAVALDLAQNDADRGVLDQRTAYLGKLEGFVAPTATAEVSKGVLDATQLVALTQFVFKQRAEVAAARVDLDKAKRLLVEKQKLLGRQRQELSGHTQRLQREAVVFTDAGEAHAAKLRLNYLVTGVDWMPSYVARLNAAHDKLALEYHGLVTQVSGEDWTDVALKLSTTMPEMTASAPQLAPYMLALRPSEAPEEAKPDADGKAAYRDERQKLEGELRGRSGRRSAAADPGRANHGPADEPASRPAAPGADLAGTMALPEQGSSADDVVAVNLLAAQLQALELAASDDAIKSAGAVKSRLTEGLATDYAIGGKVSVASRRDQQVFRIALLNLPAEFHYSAVPLLSSYVYQDAWATNTSDVPLLPGPYNAYVDGSFAGRGRLPMVAKGESMTVGFGTESQLRASRELLDKHTELKGGNKVVTLSYQVRLQNFTGKPAKVRLRDRLPQAPNAQATVLLTDPGQPLSTDPEYVELEKPRGLLRWDLEPAAGATGPKALSFTFKVTLEFDRQLDVGDLDQGLVERMKRDLNTLNDLRR